MRSNLLDYFRAGKQSRSSTSVPAGRDAEMEEAFTAAAAPAPAAPAAAAIAPAAAAPGVPVVETQPAVQRKGPLDYPAIKTWLAFCEEHLERGRDKHEYSVLLPVFLANGCTRIDDVVRLSAESIKTLAEKENVSITIGLANRVHEYAAEDVARVKANGKLYMESI